MKTAVAVGICDRLPTFKQPPIKSMSNMVYNELESAVADDSLHRLECAITLSNIL
jgi:hypothetical protein